jgi:dTDP-4-amino-4,6-dideoxygalactose transaminase
MTNSGDKPLALLGGSRAFSEPLHVGRPNLGDRAVFTERIADILDRRWLSNAGKYVQAFEGKLKEILGVRHCIPICNATVALEIATRALEFKGEVIVPSFTFVATAHALRWQGITPVFCDIDPETHNLDPDRVEELITSRTTGIIGVHLWGRPCATERLRKIADRNGLGLMYDAAHALGCEHQGRMIGNFGAAEVFSFHATKFVNSGEGGAIATNDDDLAKKIRLMKNFGFAGYDNVIYVGTNGKMDEFSSAMGLTNLESMERFIEINRFHYDTYRTELGSCPGLRLIDYPDCGRFNYQYIVVEASSSDCPLTCNELIAVLHAENVLARRYFYPGCHRMEPYRTEMPFSDATLPRTSRLCREILVLPTGSALSTDEIKVVCGLIRQALQEADAVREHIRAKAA